ncbi:hypothetical protein [Carboxylicivirga caseinilyticus]|uniref:hypothetical protein n=1 Tax=Carboxylicivirga caseinilyticus TaxID=3417572 RepID=UPI003D32FC42|nr:hypothetical protein [Marinilabiliaceae bacterium A049]
MKRLFYLLVIILLTGCSQKSVPFKFIGIWQSLNEYNAYKFTADSVDFYLEGEPFWSKAAKSGSLSYTINQKDNLWYDLRIMDGEELFVNGKIEVVNSDRIRIYLYKHHNILDLADEYIRAEDFDSFRKIMNKILKEPEEEI